MSTFSTTCSITTINNRVRINTNLRLKIKPFNTKSDVIMWFYKFEMAAGEYPKSKWFKAAINEIDEDCLAKLNDLKEMQPSENGYDQLKNRMIEFFGPA